MGEGLSEEVISQLEPKAGIMGREFQAQETAGIQAWSAENWSVWRTKGSPVWPALSEPGDEAAGGGRWVSAHRPCRSWQRVQDFLLLFLAAPMACRSSRSRDHTHIIAAA